MPPGVSSAPSGSSNFTDRSAPSRLSKTATATGPPASTPGARGVTDARQTWSAGTVARVVTSGPSRRSSSSAVAITAATADASRPAVAGASMVTADQAAGSASRVGRDRRRSSASARSRPSTRRSAIDRAQTVGRVRSVGADVAAAGLGAGPAAVASAAAASARLAVSMLSRSGAPGRPATRSATATTERRPAASRPIAAEALIAPCSSERPAGSAAGTAASSNSAGAATLSSGRRTRRRPPAPPSRGPRAANWRPAGSRRAGRCGRPRRPRTGRPRWCGRRDRSARRRRSSARPGRRGSGSIDGRIPATAQAAETVGNRRAKTAGSMPVASRNTWSPIPPGAAAIRRETASDTTSRGARSASGCTPGMIRAPAPSISTAPSPRTASVISGRCPRSPGPVQSTVGWNCMNSRSAVAAPARSAIAIPSPVATPGFVVAAYRCPAPPVASTTARQRAGRAEPSGASTDTPRARPAASSTTSTT